MALTSASILAVRISVGTRSRDRLAFTSLQTSGMQRTPSRYHASNRAQIRCEQCFSGREMPSTMAGQAPYHAHAW